MELSQREVDAIIATFKRGVESLERAAATLKEIRDSLQSLDI